MDIVTRLLWGWDARTHAPDQLGKVVVVTGANTGLGYETTLRLAERNALVVMAVRNTESGNRAAEAIRHQVRGAKLLVWHVNMASFRSVRAFASRVAASFPSGIHGLVNNAGVLNAPVSGAAATSENGIEVTRAVDYFGPVLLTHLLLPSLAAAVPSRVVSVLSLGEALGALDWGDLRGLNSPASTFRAYGCAKLMLLMWTRELNRRLRGTGIDCFAVHPGVAHTPGEYKSSGARLSSWTAWLGALVHGQTPAWAATSLIYAATEPRLASRGGAYIGPRYLHVFGYAGSNTATRAPLNPAASDPAAARRLFDETTAVLLDAGAAGGAGAARPPSPDDLAAAALAAATGRFGAAGGGGKRGAALAPLGAVAGTAGFGAEGEEGAALAEVEELVAGAAGAAMLGVVAMEAAEALEGVEGLDEGLRKK